MNLFLKSDFSFPTLQTSENVIEEIDRLHYCVIDVVNNVAPFFKKIPENLSILKALGSLKNFSF